MCMHIHQVYVVYYDLVDETCMLVVDMYSVHVSNVKYCFPSIPNLIQIKSPTEYTNGVIRRS